MGMFKLGHWVGDEWVEYSHPPVYAVQRTSTGGTKIATVAPGGDPIVFQKLAGCLTPPYFLLYVLHTPRGEGDPGRYQSRELTPAELERFLRRFGGFLQCDSRFDLWLHSATDRATIVWDRHNLVHAYGPTAPLIDVLRGLGFDRGEPTIPSPHQHHYHQALDGDAQAILASLDWIYSPLQPEDEQ